MQAPTEQELQAGRQALHSTKPAIQTFEVTDTREGLPHLLSNISVLENTANILKTTLGPYGRDKVLINSNNQFTVTNDGATILKEMNSKHPILGLLKEVSECQDKNIGDGTTSVCLVFVEILKQLVNLIDSGFDISEIIYTISQIETDALKYLDGLKEMIDRENVPEYIELVAGTALNSKILRSHKKQFSEMFQQLLTVDLEHEESIAIKKVSGGSLEDSVVLNGVVFEKTFSFAGHEQLPKYFKNPKIACLDIELEWKSERDNAEARISSLKSFREFVDAEWKLITDRLDTIINRGAQVVLSKKPIGDFATQYFAKKGVFCAGRVPSEDLRRIAALTGTQIYSSTSFVKSGECETFEEKDVGGVRYNFLEISPKSINSDNKSINNGNKNGCLTFLLRGPGEEFLNEVERSLHDAIIVLKRFLKDLKIVTGGGYIEMKISQYLRNKEIDTKHALVYKSVARALEIIPNTLARNFGLDNILEMQRLRYLISNGKKAIMSLEGAIESEEIKEPLEIKVSLIKTSFQAVRCVLGLDSSFVINQ